MFIEYLLVCCVCDPGSQGRQLQSSVEKLKSNKSFYWYLQPQPSHLVLLPSHRHPAASLSIGWVKLMLDWVIFFD